MCLVKDNALTERFQSLEVPSLTFWKLFVRTGDLLYSPWYPGKPILTFEHVTMFGTISSWASIEDANSFLLIARKEWCPGQNSGTFLSAIRYEQLTHARDHFTLAILPIQVNPRSILAVGPHDPDCYSEGETPPLAVESSQVTIADSTLLAAKQGCFDVLLPRGYPA